MELKEIIAKNLLNLRKAKKITQLELAEKFNYSDKAVSKWERAETLPDVETLHSLAEFYGVTLDYLTDEEHSKAQKKPTQKQSRLNKILVSLLGITMVWFVACVVFVTLKIGFDINYWLVYIWAIPSTCVLWVVFNSLWGKRVWRFVALTILTWSLILAVYLQLGNPAFWPLFIIGIPVQCAILFLGKIKRLKIFEKKDSKRQDKMLEQDENDV